MSTPPTIAQYRAYEFNIEPAAQAVLIAAGQPVCSAFLFVAADGNVNLQTAKSDACFVTYEPGDTRDDVLAFRASPRFDGGLATDAAGAGGAIVVTRRVPVGDAPAKPGEPPPCYEKLCRELGIIRAALLNSEQPFAALCPWYDFLSIVEVAPNRSTDGPRMANQATLRFAVRFMPAQGIWD